MKIQLFLEDNSNLVDTNSQSRLDLEPYACENEVAGYLRRPVTTFSSPPAIVNWMYIIDLDEDKFYVSIPRYGTRVFCLRNIPRWLFVPSSKGATGENLTSQNCTIFIDPVNRLHLGNPHPQENYGQTLIGIYQNCTPRVQPFGSLPGTETFSVRKYLRLYLLQLFFKTYQKTFARVNGNSGSDYTYEFNQLVYGIVNLASSSASVIYEHDNRYSATGEWVHYRTLIKRPSWDPAPTEEFWVGNILVVPEMHMATRESLQAAIGKAIHLTGICNDSSTNQVTAIIISLHSIVFVYIRGKVVSHTKNIRLFPHNVTHRRGEVETDGILGLLDVFYRPSPSPVPHSFPNNTTNHLPTEICQDIFRYANSSTKRALESTCRIFRAISQDYGPRIGEWALLKRSEKDGSTAFIAAADAGVRLFSGRPRRTPPRSAIVFITKGKYPFRPVYRAVLHLPGTGKLELDLPLLGINETQLMNWRALWGETIHLD